MEVPQVAIKQEVDNFTSEQNESYETQNSDLVEVKLGPIKIEPYSYEIASEEAKMLDCSSNKPLCDQKCTEVKLELVEAMDQNMEDTVDEKWSIENNELDIKDEELNISMSSNKTTNSSKRKKRVDSFRCDRCTYTTNQKRLLNQHLLRHKNPETTKLKYVNSTYSRRALFDIWFNAGKTFTEKNKKTKETLLKSFTEDHLLFYRKFIVERITKFCSFVEKKWEEADRNKTQFLKNNEKWLKREINLLPIKPVADVIDVLSPADVIDVLSPSQIPPSLPLLSFDENNFKLQDLQNKPIMYTPAEALLLLLDLKLSEHQYTNIQLQNKMRNADIYPPYNSLRSAKKDCYPDSNSIIIISPNEAEVELQSLLDHTASRILLSQKDILNQTLMNSVSREMNLVLKWSCGGRTTGHSQLNQGSTDTYMFITSFVPLRLNFNYLGGSEYLLLQDSRSLFGRYCRPIKIQFKNETAEFSKEEIDRVLKQIDSLVPYEVVIQNKTFSITYTMVLTSIDEKSCSSDSDQTSLDLFPIGHLLEEAQECVKLTKKGRTGRTSEENYIKDLLKSLLVLSDPYINRLRNLSQKQNDSLSKDVLDFAQIVEDNYKTSQSMDNDDSSHSESE